MSSPAALICFAIGVVAFASGCERRVPAMSDEDMQLVRNISPGMTPACIDVVRFGGMDAFPSQADQCFHMEPARRWRGLWHDAFEGSRFCPEPADDCRFETPGEVIWLFYGDPAEEPARSTGGLYEVEFIGRRTAVRGHYGHLGWADYEVVVDRLISKRAVNARQNR